MTIMKDTAYTTTEKANAYDNISPLLKAMYFEFRELAKKKPDLAVNKNKIKIVNRLLEKILFILSDEDNIDFLDKLDEDDMPQTSDVTLVLSQYTAAMETFRKKYYGWIGAEQNWFIEETNN